MIIVLLGLLDLIENGWRGLRGGGGFLILVGSFLLLFTMQLVPWPLRQAWPAGLILLGLLSLLGDAPSLSWAILLIGGGTFLLAVTTGTIERGLATILAGHSDPGGLAALIGREDSHRDEPRVPPAPPPAPAAAASGGPAGDSAADPGGRDLGRGRGGNPGAARQGT